MEHPADHTHLYQSIFILSGAGISAESGISTFRDSNGLWCNHKIEDVATPAAFEKDPELVQRFYNLRRSQLQDTAIQPNAAHLAVARLQNEFKGEVFLVTQNVDDLHERGGSPRVHHMHGELKKIRCVKCQSIFSWEEDLLSSMPCLSCQKTGTLRPHIVWFGEMPLEMDRIEAALTRCNLFIAVGTSGQVYPAAGFASQAKAFGARTILCNLESIGSSAHFDECHLGPASQRLPALVEKILATKPG